MNQHQELAATLWGFYRAWEENSFKDIDADGGRFRPRPSKSRMRRVKPSDLGSAMQLLHRYKAGSTELEKSS